MNARWESWRRDLLFALAGAVVASAVLMPVGWSHVRAERQRAEAAEEEVTRQRAIAEDQTRNARQEAERAAAEREKAERASEEHYRLLEQLHWEPEVKARINPGPQKTHDELVEELRKQNLK